ncbi:MAG: hypothetical protein ACOC92_00195 [bacterium]
MRPRSRVGADLSAVGYVLPFDREALEEALDRERRERMRADEERLERYRKAAEAWAALWPRVAREIEGRPLAEAHRVVVSRAEEVLPFEPAPGGGG